MFCMKFEEITGQSIPAMVHSQCATLFYKKITLCNIAKASAITFGFLATSTADLGFNPNLSNSAASPAVIKYNKREGQMLV